MKVKVSYPALVRALVPAGFGFLWALATAPLWRHHVLTVASYAVGVMAAAWCFDQLTQLLRRPPPPPAASPSEPILDPAGLASLRALGDEAFVRDVAEQFITEGRLLMLRVAQATADRNISEFSAHLHALRSSAANVGARRLFALCLAWRNLDASELAGSVGSTRLHVLQQEFETACDVLRATLWPQGEDETSRPQLAETA